MMLEIFFTPHSYLNIKTELYQTMNKNNIIKWVWLSFGIKCSKFKSGTKRERI